MSNATDKQQDKTVYKHKVIDKPYSQVQTVVEGIFKRGVKAAEVYIPDGITDPDTGETLSKDDVLTKMVAAIHRATERGELRHKHGRLPLIELFRENPGLVGMSAYKVRGRTGYSVEHVNKVRATDAYADLLAERREEKRTA